jgi:hypothetical protein
MACHSQQEIAEAVGYAVGPVNEFVKTIQASENATDGENRQSSENPALAETDARMGAAMIPFGIIPKEGHPRAHGRQHPSLYPVDPADNPNLGRALTHRCDDGCRIGLKPRVLDAHDDKAEREKAFQALRQEIEGFDARVEKERAKASVRVEAVKDPGAPEGNRNAAKGDENKGRNSTVDYANEPKRQKRDAAYWIARLKRDAASAYLRGTR